MPPEPGGIFCMAYTPPAHIRKWQCPLSLAASLPRPTTNVQAMEHTDAMSLLLSEHPALRKVTLHLAYSLTHDCRNMTVDAWPLAQCGTCGVGACLHEQMVPLLP